MTPPPQGEIPEPQEELPLFAKGGETWAVRLVNFEGGCTNTAPFFASDLVAFLAALPTEQKISVLRAATGLVDGFENLAAAGLGIAKELREERDRRMAAERLLRELSDSGFIGAALVNGCDAEAIGRMTELANRVRAWRTSHVMPPPAGESAEREGSK